MVSEANQSPGTEAHRPAPERFYRRRQRFSLCLLLFVVIVGLPIVGVPSLRNRLSMRVMALKMAIAGDRKQTIVEVGSNREPLPPEYRRPEPVAPRPPELPHPERVFTLAEPVTNRGRPARVIITEKPSKPASRTEEQVEQAAADTAAAPSEESEIRYQRGKAEQDAYDLLLKSNQAVAEMVQGRNPALRFRSWDAADRGEDTYWVRLKFQSEGNAEAEYIWIVKPQANLVSPLNYNARSIAQ